MAFADSWNASSQLSMITKPYADFGAGMQLYSKGITTSTAPNSICFKKHQNRVGSHLPAMPVNLAAIQQEIHRISKPFNRCSIFTFNMTSPCPQPPNKPDTADTPPPASRSSPSLPLPPPSASNELAPHWPKLPTYTDPCETFASPTLSPMPQKLCSTIMAPIFN